jgi:hypothetical protein
VLVVCMALVSCREQAVINGAFGDPPPAPPEEEPPPMGPMTGGRVGTGTAGAGGGAGGTMMPPPDARPAPPADARNAGGTGGGTAGTGGAAGTGGSGGAQPPPPPPPDGPTDTRLPPDPPPISRSALLVVGSAQLIATDVNVRDRLSARLVVRVLPEAEADADDARGMALVMITSSVTAAGTNSKFRDVAVPVIVLEPNLLGPMRLTADTAEARGATGRDQTRLTIVRDHPLAAGFTGAVTVYRTPWRLTWGVPSSEAIRVATVDGDPNRSVIFVYPVGAQMVGAAAPAKRLVFFIHDNTADNLTLDATTLLDAAIAFMVE